MLSAVALFSGISIVTVIISVAYLVVQIIANWILLEKAGEKGWKSIIPFYGDYTLYKVVWQPKMYWIYLVLVIVEAVIEYLADRVFPIIALGTVFTIVQMVFLILSLIVQFYFCRKLAFSFGKSSGFAVGLFFLYPIFSMILAFGSSRFISKSNTTTYL
ncbi:MAG: DUF5684 domain-containing protein [Ruminococcus sp.]|nr:DUF5684 domain-containing protein [Ruminococcus sp.]